MSSGCRPQITDRTRVIVMVTPANPTGWTATHDDLRAVLALARKHGLWIVADETYARFWYGEGNRAPSFLDIMAPEDRILFVNTFSKNWSHDRLADGLDHGSSLARSGGREHDPVFDLGRCAIHAAGRRGGAKPGRGLRGATGRARATEPRRCLRHSRDAPAAAASSPPQGAFYLFFSVDGETDSEALARRLVDEAQVGLAPGTAFGAGGEHFLRLCFARDPEQIRDACERIARVLTKSRSRIVMRGLARGVIRARFTLGSGLRSRIRPCARDLGYAAAFSPPFAKRP